MAQAHALLTAQMAEKIEKLAEMLEQLLTGDDEEVSVIRWRMLRVTHQLANDLEGLDNNSVMHQLHEQTQWLMRKSRESDQQYQDVETSLESVGKTLEALHNRMKQLDQRLSTMSTGLHALQQHLEQSSVAITKEEKADLTSSIVEEEKKPVFELQFHVAPSEHLIEEPSQGEEVTAPEADSPSEEEIAVMMELPLPEIVVEAKEEPVLEEEVPVLEDAPIVKSPLHANEEETVIEGHETPLGEQLEPLELSDVEEKHEEIPLATTEALTPEVGTADVNEKLQPAPLRIASFFDPRTLTLAERQKADNLKTAITLVEKFQLSKAFFGGDDNAFGQALDLINKMHHLEEAEQYLALLAEQYRWDVSDPQLLVLVKAVWRKLGVR